METRTRGRKYRRNSPVAGLLRAAQQRSRKRGWFFDLTEDDLGGIPTHCPYLGIELRFVGGRATANSPSLDRIDNSLGYVRGNVMIISHRANMLKSDSTLEEAEMMVVARRRFEKPGIPCAE